MTGRPAGRRQPGPVRRGRGQPGPSWSLARPASSAPAWSAACSADGARVRVLVRSPGKAGWLAGRGAEVITGDITDRAAVRAAVNGCRRGLPPRRAAVRARCPGLGIPADARDRHEAAAGVLPERVPPEAVRALQHHGRARGDRGLIRPTSRRRSGRPTSTSQPRRKPSGRSWTRATLACRPSSPGPDSSTGRVICIFCRSSGRSCSGGSGPSAVSRSGCTRSTSTT